MFVKSVVVSIKWISCQVEAMEKQETWTLSESRGADWIIWLGRSKKVKLSFLNNPNSPFYFNSWDQHKVICQRKNYEVDLLSWDPTQVTLCCYQSCTDYSGELTMWVVERQRNIHNNGPEEKKSGNSRTFSCPIFKFLCSPQHLVVALRIQALQLCSQAENIWITIQLKKWH